LDLSDFINLKELDCHENKLTILNLSNCSQLEKTYCKNNLLTDITLPKNSTNLKILGLPNNNFPIQDLSFLTPYTNLEELYLGNFAYSWDNSSSKEKIDQGIYNKFTGSLDYLSGMRQLKQLYIGNTDLSEVDLAKLPSSLWRIGYSTELRPNCQLTKIVPLLDNYNKYGRCQKCQKPNTGYNDLCQPCQNQK